MAGTGTYSVKLDAIIIGGIQSKQEDGSNLQKCVSPEDFDEYIMIYNDLLKLGESGVAEHTGCLPSCERDDYSVRRVQQKSNRPGKKVMQILISG